MHGKADQEPDGIGDDVTLAPLDPLTGIIPANPTTFSGFYALTIDHARRRAGRAPFGLTRRRDELAVQLFHRPLSRQS